MHVWTHNYTVVLDSDSSTIFDNPMNEWAREVCNTVHLEATNIIDYKLNINAAALSINHIECFIYAVNALE